MNVLPFSFLCYTKQRYWILKTLPSHHWSTIPPAQGWNGSWSLPLAVFLLSFHFHYEETIHLSSERTFLQWAMDGLRTANRIWRLSLLCWSSEPGPAGERLKGINVCQLCEINEGIYSTLHFITPTTLPALSASEQMIYEHVGYFPTVAALFKLRLNHVEQEGCAGVPILWLCCARRKICNAVAINSGACMTCWN